MPRDTIYDEIEKERDAQIARGYDSAHDDEHSNCEIAVAAGCYAIDYALGQPPKHMYPWPWDGEGWRDRPPREKLIAAAALLVAEVDRIDRARIR